MRSLFVILRILPSVIRLQSTKKTIVVFYQTLWILQNFWSLQKINFLTKKRITCLEGWKEWPNRYSPIGGNWLYDTTKSILITCSSKLQKRSEASCNALRKNSNLFAFLRIWSQWCSLLVAGSCSIASVIEDIRRRVSAVSAEQAIYCFIIGPKRKTLSASSKKFAFISLVQWRA